MSDLSRPTKTYKIPASSREWPTDPESVTLRSWTAGQEVDALRVVSGRFEFELLDRIIVKVNGKPADQGVSIMAGFSPKVRGLLVLALDDMGVPSKKDREDFLSSGVLDVA